jgi:hypothetical protein
MYWPRVAASIQHQVGVGFIRHRKVLCRSFPFAIVASRRLVIIARGSTLFLFVDSV